MRLSKNKFFVCVLLLSVTIYLMSAPIARADFLISPIEVIGDFITDNLLVVMVVVVIVVLVVIADQYELLPVLTEVGTAEVVTYGKVVGDTIVYTQVVDGVATMSWTVELSSAAEASSFLAAETISSGAIAELGLTTITGLSEAAMGQITAASLFTFTTTTFVATLGIVSMGSIAAVTTLCVSGPLCPGGSQNLLVSVKPPTQSECVSSKQFQIPVTFYIPSFNQGWVSEPGQGKYCYPSGEYDLNADPIMICETIPGGAQRYDALYAERSEGGMYLINLCDTPNQSGNSVMVNGTCYRVVPVTTTWQPIDETQNQIAIYRVTAPVSQFQTSTGEIDKNALAVWYTGIYGTYGGYMFGTSEHKFGDGLAYYGWNDEPPIIQNRPAENLLAVVDYADICSGNVCNFTDSVKVPENSFIFYAAKIADNYILSWSHEVCTTKGGEDICNPVVDLYSSPAKFLNTDNSSTEYAKFPWVSRGTYTTGNAFTNPIQTGALGACEYLLTVTKNGTGFGTVNPSSGTLFWTGNIGKARYSINDSVTLTATADAGSTFIDWSGCDSVSGNDCTVAMTAAKSVTATFTQNPSLTVIKDGTGSGVVISSPAGIACGLDCSAPFNFGASVTLTATADAGSAFAGWSVGSNGCDSVSGNDCTVTMDAAKSVTATFNLGLSFTLTVTKDGSTGTGSVTSDVGGIICGSDCIKNYASGANVILTVAPASGSYNLGLSSNCSPLTADTCMVTMDSSKTVNVSFGLLSATTYFITPTTAAKLVGQTQQFTAWRDPDGPSGPKPATNITNSSAWSSSNTAIATVTNSGNRGLATCVADGLAAISFVYSGQRRTASLACGNTPVGTVNLDGWLVNSDCSLSPMGVLSGYVLLNLTGPAGSNWSGTNNTPSAFSFKPIGDYTLNSVSSYVGGYQPVNGRCGYTNGSSGGVPKTQNLSSNGTITFTGYFEAINYNLTVTKSGTGSGSVTSDVGGIICGSDCIKNYAYGTNVTLNVLPSSDSYFLVWSGDGCSGSGACSTSMIRTRTINAEFRLLSTYVIDPPSADKPIGQTQQFIGWFDPDGSSGSQAQQNLTNSASWTSENPAIATVSDSGNKGLATCITNGSVTITSVYSSHTATASLNCSISNNPPWSSGNPGASLSVSKGDYCANASHSFSWTYTDPDGDAESKFRLQIDNNSDFLTPEVDRTDDNLSYPPSGTTNTQQVLVSSLSLPDQLAYNTTYYWRVRVWDSYGAVSGWVSGTFFTTEKHRYPTIDFNWSPVSPIINQDVRFNDLSSVFGSGTTIGSRSWSIPNANYQGGTDSSSQNPRVKFTSTGLKYINLTVTDSPEGYSCSLVDSLPLSVSSGVDLPGWKEIPPQ